MYQPVKKALQAVGNQGRYQKLLVVFLFFIAAEVNYMLIGPTFIFMNPLFRCSFTQDIVDQSIACDRISQCLLDSPYTIVGSLGLYCDRQVERDLIQSVGPFGAVAGLLIVNYLSDNKGRKFAAIFVQIIAIFSISMTIIGGYADSVPILVISQFFGGFAGFSMLIVAYIIPTQYCDQQFRQKLIIIINYSWALTMVLIGVLYYTYNLWYNFQIFFVLLPSIAILAISWFFLVEGPNFLYDKKREKQCLESLKVIALYNNTLKEYELAAINFKFQSSQIRDNPETYNLKAIFRDRKYLKMMLLLMSIEIGGNLNYLGTNYAMDEIGLDYGGNMILAGSIQFLAFATMHMIINKLPKKKTFIALYGAAGMLGFLFFIPFFRENRIASFIILGIIRYITAISYTLLIMLMTQSFPLQIQSICVGIIQSIAQIGMVLAPIFVTICINYQIYPMVLLSFIVMIMVVLPSFGLKQPNRNQQQIKQNLIQSIEQKLS